MAIADIVSVTGTIQTGGDLAENITAFNGSTFLNTIKQDLGFVAYTDALGAGANLYEISFIWDGQSHWEMQIVLYGQRDAYTITTDSGPYTLAQLGVTANNTNAGVDFIMLTVEYSAYEFPDMFYTADKYNQGIVTAFDIDTFVGVLNQDTALKEHYRGLGSPVPTVVVVYSNGDGTWSISFENSDYSWVSNWYDESGSYTLAQLGITADLTVSGNDAFYVVPDDGYTLPPMLGVIDEGGDHTITDFDADAFMATMNQDAFIVGEVRYYYGQLTSIDFENGSEGWAIAIDFNNDNVRWYDDYDSPYTLAQFGITADLSEDGYDTIYLLKKEAGVTSAKAYGPVSGASKRVHKLYGSVNGESVEIKKLYGSVNGESKLIYKAMPYYPATAYGVVYYKPVASGSTVRSVILQSQAEFDSLCNQAHQWAVILGNGSVTVKNNDTRNVIVGVEIGQNIIEIRPGFMFACSMLNMPLIVPNNVIRISPYFLNFCTTFNQTLTLPSNLSEIMDDFLYNCQSFNQPLTLPNSVKYIRNNFMRSCSSFNQPLSLPSGLTTIETYFMNNCNSMVSEVNVGSLNANIVSSNNYTFATSSGTAACYTTGITIAGANRAAWRTKFPDSTSSPYRKTLDAGY